ncbi:MAG TPA: flagellar FliJ family protein [Candidatus Angelobacter sp.]|jgi:flagellar export protein FliJ
MAFRFALESVLRLRVSYERQEQARLELATQHLYAAREKCAVLKKEQSALEANFRTTMASGMDASELHSYLSSKLGLEVAEAEAARAEAGASKLWNEQRTKFLRARQDREVIASIRLRQHQEYVVEQNRKEQQQIDDLFAMRRIQSNG